MKPVLSPFEILDFVIVNSTYSFNAPTGKQNIFELMSKYEIDTNYKFESAPDHIRIYTKVAVNNSENPLPGYSIFAEGMAIFSFNKKAKLSDEEKRKFVNYSGIPITLNCLRGFLINLTATGPLGRYTLPSFDLNDLMNQKIKQLSVAGKRKRKVGK